LNRERSDKKGARTGGMNERSTNRERREKETEIYPESEVSDIERMGKRRERGINSAEIWNTSEYAVQMEEGIGKRSADFFEREAYGEESTSKRAGRGEPETAGSAVNSDERVDVIKKKDELGLSNRKPGESYDKKQRELIIAEVLRLKGLGISKTEALRRMGVCRSSYYSWIKGNKRCEKPASIQRLTVEERNAVIDIKRKEPQLSHRQISGWLRHKGYWISSSSCYRILRECGWIFPYQVREKPWKTARYEPYRPNMIWGEDWTILTIAGTRYYLLTIIDYFSRYIVAWGIVKTVTHKNVQDILSLAYMSEKIDEKVDKPIIRFDRGSPNMARETRRFIKEMELVLSPSRANRPTDNARQERWYRTIKQEEIYCYPEYPNLEIAKELIGRYIEEYNKKRPHQILWNFTPEYVHKIGNKSKIYEQYKERVNRAKSRRIALNTSELLKGKLTVTRKIESGYSNRTSSKAGGLHCNI